jgi:hypothetical protein
MMSEAITRSGLKRAVGRRAVLNFVMGLGLALCPLSRAAQSVALAWNPSPAGNVAGYVIHYGNNGTNYSNQVDAGTNTSWSVKGLQEGETNYFVVAAYDANHMESPPSNQTVFFVPGVVQIGARTHARQAASLNFPVAPGHTYQVQASTDLQNWVTIWETTATTNTWVQFQDPAAVNLKMRFYRTVSY